MDGSSRNGWRIMSDSILTLEFQPATDAGRRNDGWGCGLLSVRGRPYWYFNTEDDPRPVEWTWAEFLEHIAKSWGYLTSEQTYPYSWLYEAPHPGDLWKIAERRWARLGDATADEEEQSLIKFDRRHNLSAGWKGIGLPALSWLRVGETLWLCPEGVEPIRTSFRECLHLLISFGDKLASAYTSSDNPRVASAVEAWRQRGDTLQNTFVEIVTGLSKDLLRTIQDAQPSSSFWEFPANSNWESGDLREGELLAAARMTAGVLEATKIVDVIRTLRDIKKQRSDTLDRFSDRTTNYIAGLNTAFAFDAGYRAAEFFKDIHPDTKKKYVDIHDVLNKLNVQVVEVDLGSAAIDAIAVWGGRGPCILLNSSRAYAESKMRTRMTLGHELCHLLLDRKGGLPFCEVLGGRVDDFIERRANAFAAELLLPRMSVEHDWILWKRKFKDFLLMLEQEYGVSRSVACAQIFNSSVFIKIDNLAQRYVESRVLDFEGREQPPSVHSTSGIV